MRSVTHTNRSNILPPLAAAVLGMVFAAQMDAVEEHAPGFTNREKERPLQSHDHPESWSHYGGSLRGDRHAAQVSISPESVPDLTEVWRFRTGDSTSGNAKFGRASSFKATPVLHNGTLYFSTGFNRVFALDAETGLEKWRFDPRVDFSIEYSEMYTSRGVSVWVSDKAGRRQACSARIFLGTLDARLIALDAATGQKCSEFGRNGEIDLTKGIRRVRRGEYSVTSPPTVIDDVVIVGSSIGDNGSARLEDGTVRAFGARDGKLRWQFDPIGDYRSTNGSNRQIQTGGANVWSTMAADVQNRLVFLPTTSPSPDFFGGQRLGDNLHANSIIALDITTGQIVWSYQIVRHDLWDYDLAAQPLLIDLQVDGEVVPAIAVATKMGSIFVLNRLTGMPILPVEERSVPKSTVPGETASPTQRFPLIQLHPVAAHDAKLWQLDEKHVRWCRRAIEGVRYDGIFTPPSLEGSLLFPGNAGGVNWGSMAADPSSGIGLVAVNRWPTVVKLFKRKEFAEAEALGRINGVEAEFTEQADTPYGMGRFELYNRSNGLPCFEGPWSTLVAVDLASGHKLWERPVGAPEALRNMAGLPDWGYFVRGGPITTAGGVTFLATPFDFRLSAFDTKTGQPLWYDELPAQPEATPMAYRIGEKDFIAVTAGGKLRKGSGQGDYLIAYALPAKPG